MNAIDGMIGRTRMPRAGCRSRRGGGGRQRRRRRRNRFAQVVDELGRRVVRGELRRQRRPADRAELAAELGVSRNLLREAVKVLAGKGLLEVRPQARHAAARPPDWHLLDPDVLAWLDGSGHRLERSFDLVEFRLIVEPKASYLAAVRGTPAEKRAIARSLHRARGLRRPPRAGAGPRHRLPPQRPRRVGQRDPEPPGLADRVADADPGADDDRTARARSSAACRCTAS